MKVLGLIARACNLLESEPEAKVARYLSGLGFTQTHYKDTHYDKINRTDHEVHVGDEPHPRYNIVSVDFDKGHALVFGRRDGKYKKLALNKMKADYSGKIISEE